MFVRCWMYHATAGKRLIETETEFAELGPGWCDHPDAAAAYVPGADPAPETLSGVSLAKAQPFIETAGAETIAAWLATEEAAEAPRKSVLQALQARLDTLTAPPA